MTSVQTSRRHGVNGSLAIKAPCVVATTANITLSGLQAIDGITVAAGDRVLVKDQATGSENGIYAASSSSWQREPDFDGARDVVEGTLVFVTDGSTTKGYWRVTTPDPISPGSTSLSFESADVDSVLRNDLASTATDDGTKGFHLVSYPPLSGETGVTDYEYPPGDVRRYGAVGNGTTDDTTALQNAFAYGDVYLPQPSVNYLISDELQIVGGSSVRGEAGSNSNVIIKVADNSNITGAVIVSKEYKDDATTAGAPVWISGIYINGNSDNNTGTCHGMLLMNYRSTVFGCETYKTTGDGIQFIDKNSAGTNITGTAVENRVSHCIITNCGKRGIFIDANTNAMTDGKINDNVIASTTEEGIYCKRGSGWQIHDNQVYDIGYSGIRIDNGWHSSIRDNDVQGWGSSATTGTYYGCVIFSITADDRPCSIAGNIISQNVALVASTTYYACGITSSATPTDAHASVLNNTYTANSDNSEWFLHVTGSGASNVYVSGNAVFNVNENRFIAKNAGDTVRHYGNSFDEQPRTMQSSATPDMLQGNTYVTGAGTVTMTNLLNGYPGQKVTIIFAHASWNIDFTGTNLKGNVGADWSPAINDHMVCVCQDGTTWHCQVSDNTA